jgi:hypothetical protein
MNAAFPSTIYIHSWPRRSALFLIPLVLICFALFQNAQAVSPPPDGGYPGGNTAEGHNALFGLTTGSYNTAVGFFSLSSNPTNSFNTAIGAGMLLANTADNNTATGAAALLSNTTGAFNTHRHFQHCQRGLCTFKQQHRRREHGQRLSCAQWQRYGRRQHCLRFSSSYFAASANRGFEFHRSS